MCFSAEASFIVGGSLVVIGTAIIKRIHAKNEIPVALIPLIFAAQQTMEGLLWISLDSDNLQAQFWLSNSYGVFVGVIWPLYVPFAIYFAETDNTRKKIIAFIGLSGLLLALYTVIGIARQPVTAEIINNSIYYEHDVHIYPVVIIFYLVSYQSGKDVEGEPVAHGTGAIKEGRAFTQAVERFRHQHEERAHDAQPMAKGMSAARFGDDFIGDVHAAKDEDDDKADF